MPSPLRPVLVAAHLVNECRPCALLFALCSTTTFCLVPAQMECTWYQHSSCRQFCTWLFICQCMHYSTAICSPMWVCVAVATCEDRMHVNAITNLSMKIMCRPDIQFFYAIADLFCQFSCFFFPLCRYFYFLHQFIFFLKFIKSCV